MSKTKQELFFEAVKEFSENGIPRENQRTINDLKDRRFENYINRCATCKTWSGARICFLFNQRVSSHEECSKFTPSSEFYTR